MVYLVTCLVLAALAACGGGGSDVDESPQPGHPFVGTPAQPGINQQCISNCSPCSEVCGERG